MSTNVFNGSLGKICASKITAANSYTAYITFVGAGSSLSTSAPITGVTITQGVDYSITKALNSDYAMAVFGDRPVSIRITGINLFRSASFANGEQILKFYNENKASSGLSKRIKVSIASSSYKKAFTCALINLTTEIDDKKNVAGYYTYSIELLGVEE